MRLALMFGLPLAMGCHSIAGIEDVTLAADTGIDSTPSVSDTLDDTSSNDVSSETAACASSRGPTMVEVVHPGGAFCMDVTEVTNDQFAEYAAAAPSVTLPARCAGVARTYPGPVGEPNGPQFNVGWCDAWAFCSWAGKRLCGPLDTGKPIGSDNSEWTWACTQGGTTTFPYGDTYDGSACVSGRTDGSALPAAVASLASCRGTAAPYDALHDLSGNVSEWVDECSGTKCRALGGYYGDTDTQALRCTSINSSTGLTVEHEVNTALSGLGFRCCR